MTALKSDEKAELPTDLAVLPTKLNYRVSKNYFSLFLFACRSRGCYFLPLLLENLCICVVLTTLSSLQQVESKILNFQCQNSNLDSRSCRKFR